MFLQRILGLTLFWLLAAGLWTVNAEENLSIDVDNEDVDSRRRKKRAPKKPRKGKKARRKGKKSKKRKG